MRMRAGGSGCPLPRVPTSPIEAQVTAPGATWIDRQLSRANRRQRRRIRSRSSRGDGARVDHLVEEGLARRQGQRVIFARDLLDTLRQRELGEASANSRPKPASPSPSAEGEHVAGVYRQRVTLASGRFAMIDDGLGFQLVPWRPALERQLGREVSGVMAPGGRVEWNFGRRRGIGI